MNQSRPATPIEKQLARIEEKLDQILAAIGEPRRPTQSEHLAAVALPGSFRERCRAALEREAASSEKRRRRKAGDREKKT